MTIERKANRLAQETSPYLRQHAHNPVDWYAWGEEALERARKEDRPIFLSVGYSSCHWCHVMERESFENEETAALMNEWFVCIKVDREERPDLDDVYMTATQLMTGQGGWPNSVFLTPELKPFYAGTYFPPEAFHGRPGFKQVLQAVREAYRDKRQDVGRISEEVAGRIRAMSTLTASPEILTGSLLNRAFGDLAGRFDNAEGGFGGAPKFPHPMEISFLLRYHRRTGNPEALRMAVVSLDKMARGGIRDQLGGGFHRYSVDARWLVPHFEKMMYDNALLARTYLEAAQVVAAAPSSAALAEGGAEIAAFFREVARDTLDWALREMTSAEGGFYSALDADSEGEEGKYYVWSAQEISEALGSQEAQLFGGVYGVTPGGNFEKGHSILHLPRSVAEAARALASDPGEVRLRLASARAKLLKARERRVRPGLDDKILADWNGLMIGTMAFAGRVLDDARYIDAARRAARLVLDRMRPGGRLHHSYKDGEARHPGYLTDHAFLLAALLDLYEATFEADWVSEARGVADAMCELFWDDAEGGFFLTARDRETPIARRHETNDGATPMGASVACLALPRLASLTGATAYVKRTEETLRLYRDGLERFPAAFGAMLCAVDHHLSSARQVVLAAAPQEKRLRPLLAALREAYLPNAVVALADPGTPQAAGTLPLLEGKLPGEGGAPAAYVCEAGACKAPVDSAEAMLRLLA
jgi:uncharacterized protein